MGYEDRIPDKVRSMGQRVDERLALWRAMIESFQAEGVEDELAGRMNDIQRKFNTVLEKLEAML